MARNNRSPSGRNIGVSSLAEEMICRAEERWSVGATHKLERPLSSALAKESGRSSLWVAPTDHRSSARHIISSASEDTPIFLPDGDLLFRAIEGGTNFLYRMHADGSDRRKVTPNQILDLSVLSPDGRWAVVQAPDANAEHTYAIL